MKEGDYIGTPVTWEDLYNKRLKQVIQLEQVIQSLKNQVERMKNSENCEKYHYCQFTKQCPCEKWSDK